ncbi:transporter, putative [Alloactinosynnema sp. L-07]|uniref:MFS transporter n=1 Tax=Alloactinosynnema sp. L-07 TaxID=1653480 RepID=UPI00065F08B6|nr:MFS transporter [Alloactinosynnema sp. L-07]CRK58694.1 transporter, putative [Alloactinosynnema sp. L-07]
MPGRRDLLLVASGSAVSMFGTAVTLIVLLLHAKTFGSFAVVSVLIAEFVPVTLGAPLAGLLVDRLPNRRLMIIGQVVQAGAVIGVVAVLHTLPLVLVMLVFLGCGTAVVNPAAAAMVPVICGERDSTRGYAVVATGRTLGMLAGSAAGGLLVATLGTRDALYIDAATYLVQAAMLGFVRTERDPRGARRRRRQGDALAGWRHVAADPVLRVASVSLAVAMAGVMAADVANVFYVTDVLRGGAATLGVLHAAWMAGVFVGVRVAGRSRTERALLTGLGLSCCAMGIAMLVPALLPFTAPVALGYLLGGAANGLQNVCNQGLLRSRTPEHLRGRVFATAGAILIGSNVLGTVLGGAVVAVFGARPSFAIAGVAALVAGLAALRALRAVGTTKPASVT